MLALFLRVLGDLAPTRERGGICMVSTSALIRARSVSSCMEGGLRTIKEVNGRLKVRVLLDTPGPGRGFFFGIVNGKLPTPGNGSQFQ